MALSLSGVLSVASSVVQSYPSITSAYLFGSHAKGTAHPDSDVDIALFLPSFCWLKDIGGVHMDLESAFGRKVDLAVCPHDEFVERIKMYWIPIDLRGEPATDGTIDMNASHIHDRFCSISSDESKDRLRRMARTCQDLIKCVDHVNSIGGVSKVDSDYRYEHAICNCINLLGESIKTKSLGFDPKLQKNWSHLTDITAQYHEPDLSKVWAELPKVSQALLAAIEAKLR